MYTPSTWQFCAQIKMICVRRTQINLCCVAICATCKDGKIRHTQHRSVVRGDCKHVIVTIYLHITHLPLLPTRDTQTYDIVSSERFDDSVPFYGPRRLRCTTAAAESPCWTVVGRRRKSHSRGRADAAETIGIWDYLSFRRHRRRPSWPIARRRPADRAPPSRYRTATITSNSSSYAT